MINGPLIKKSKKCEEGHPRPHGAPWMEKKGILHIPRRFIY